jgi:nucleotide-binding universal stress UspA family protein
MYRILVPLDGSSRGERAITVADQLAGALCAEVKLLRVLDPADILTTSSAAVSPGLLDTRERLAKEYLYYAAKRFRLAPSVATEVVRGPACDTLAGRACSGECDLIVMSSQGQTGLAGALLGSVACSVLRRSAVPVLVIRERVSVPQDPRGLRVLVPLDGFEVAERVLVPLLPLSQALNWRLTLLWVAEVPPREVLAEKPDLPVAALVRQENPEMVAYLEGIAARVRATGVEADIQIEMGDRAACIVRCTQSDDVDLIAMSTHGRHGVERFVLGSVTENVMHYAGKPVLGVRPSPDANPRAKGIGR